MSYRRNSSSPGAHKSRSAPDGFDFDPLGESVSVNSGSTVREENEREQREHMKEVAQLASVFLQVRKGIMSTRGIEVAQSEAIEFEPEPTRGPHIRTISKSASRRAEKVKAVMTMHYFSVFQLQSLLNERYAGVDGVYNPLQIIRNRKIRKRHHEPPHSAAKTVTMPSQAFSMHKHKMVWQIDMDELTDEITWRTGHWHELTGPDGQLWFSDRKSSQKNTHSDTHNDRPEITNMHDRLFADDEFSDEERSERGTRQRLVDKIRKRSKSPFKKLHQSTPELSPKAQTTTPPTENSADMSHFHTPSAARASLLDLSVEPIRPLLRPTTTDSALSLNGYTTQESSTASTDLEFEGWKRANQYLHRMKRLNAIVEFGEHNHMVKTEQYSRSINYDRIFNDSEELESSIAILQEKALPSYEAKLKSRMQELDKIHDELANDFSTRVDRLLLLSDRTIGEVNTTLSLEARKLAERQGRLGPLHKRTDDMVAFAYWLLENLVVLLLWTIWVGFSIGRTIKFSVVLIFRLLVWIL